MPLPPLFVQEAPKPVAKTDKKFTSKAAARKNKEGNTTSVPISAFPPDVQQHLQEIDNGDGMLDLYELDDIFNTYRILKANNDSGELKVKMAPKEIQSVLSRFDIDGDGTISPEELCKAADLYEASLQSQKRLMRITIGLMFLLVLILVAIGVLCFMVMELAKESQTEDSGMAMVKGTNTPLAGSQATNSKTLYDSHTMSLTALKAVNTLSLSDKAGLQHFGYTITGFTKDSAIGAVTFFSSRGDEILCTAAKVTVTERCDPVPPEATCTGRKLLELSKSDVATSRRLAQKRFEELTASGRRLDTMELRRLQLELTNLDEPSLSGPAEADPTSQPEEVCPDGTSPIAGQCPDACEDNMPMVCPPDNYAPEAVWEAATSCFRADAGAVAPSTGLYTSNDQTLVNVAANAGDIAPLPGTFCPEVARRLSKTPPAARAARARYRAKGRRLQQNSTIAGNSTNESSLGLTSTRPPSGPSLTSTRPPSGPNSTMRSTAAPTVSGLSNSTTAGVPDCECPTKCPDGQEACYADAGGMVCDDIRFPFKKALTQCLNKCEQWRDSLTGKCMALCGDPNNTQVFDTETETKCPVMCPDLSEKATQLGLNASDVFGDVYRPDWVSATSEVPRDQLTKLMCPKLCSLDYGSEGIHAFMSWGPDHACPRKCADESGKDLIEPNTNSPVYSWPDQDCPTICSTGALVEGGQACPIYCPNATGQPMWDASRNEASLFWPSNVEGLSEEEIRQQTCPEVCWDETIDWSRMGCSESSTTTTTWLPCPGEPKDCEGNIIMSQDVRGKDCPILCPTTRNCWLQESGLIYPASGEKCPAPCYSDGELMYDASGDLVFDWGEGCPGRCPKLTQGDGSEISAEYLSYRRLSAGNAGPGPREEKFSMRGRPHHRQISDQGAIPARRLREGEGDKILGMWFPPVYACPLACLNKDGSAMMNEEGTGKSWQIIMPLKSKWDYAVQKLVFKAVQGTDDELRAQMCPMKCPGVDYFIWPDWVVDEEGFETQKMTSGESSCPKVCSDGSWVWPLYGQTCDGGRAPGASEGSTMGTSDL